MALATRRQKGDGMVTYLVLAYLVVAVAAMVAVALIWSRRGRWSDNWNDHLAVIIVGLAWPVLLPLGILFFIIEFARHLATATRNELEK